MPPQNHTLKNIPMPHNLSIFSFQFSPPPAARHYNSALSIWLSVDPMSDKYPGVSPYTYCANNPVRLVDPDGRTWKEKKDGRFASYLINQAKMRQAELLKKNYSIESEEYKMLQEGIDGLTYMGEVEEFTFTFSEAKNIDHLASGEIAEGNVTRDDNGIFHINYLTSFNNPEVKKGSAWHESVHLTRFLKNDIRYLKWEKQKNGQEFSFPFILSEYGYSFSNKKLGLKCRCDEERYVYSSQYIFSPKSMPIYGFLPLTKEDIPEYVRKHYHECK